MLHGGRIVPVYPQHNIINTKWLREKMALVKPVIDQLEDPLPKEVVEENGLLSYRDTVRALHFPDDLALTEKAKERLAFEELYGLQREALLKKQEWQGHHQKRLEIPMDTELIKALFASLSFTPTNSQKIAIYEILRDMEKDQPMSRLLEGDVGSGKTLVAVSVIANVIRHSGQCALMVPTEVLAKQHSEGITRLLVNFHRYLTDQKKADHAFPHLPSIVLLTGSTPSSEALAIKQGLATGTIDLVIGTHALIEESVTFKDLKLVIVDEQHRFGVMQRAKLKEKGSPHFLAMTATPIPRTLALTAFGDHDLSVLLEKPGNRKKIHTKVVPPKDRTTVERFIDHEIEQGRQVFVICPLITESAHDEMAEVKNVETERARLQHEFPKRSITMLHGKMTPAEKEEIMRRFKARESDILVSTSVIEVGIDIPNATIIVIEGSERFGLAQLHQFRGRVGRSDIQSHCFLFTTSPEQARSQRLKAMEQHDSGFMLAEIDLHLRGPGELYGLRQSGIGLTRLSGLLNPELVVKARRAAEKVLGMVGTSSGTGLNV
jgi:ATP-dependent DNA helicase RecG